MLRPKMSDEQRKDLVGTKIRYAVIRDGVKVERFGTITRVNPITVWVGVYCYLHSELIDISRIGEAI